MAQKPHQRGREPFPASSSVIAGCESRAEKAPDPFALDCFIRAYEAAGSQGIEADLTAYLPEPSHPLYSPVLRELVRVDLELSWERGRPKRLEDYKSAFPQLFRDRESLQEIAFEEYRLRRQAGENPLPTDYEERFGLGRVTWPVPNCSGDGGPAEQKRGQDPFPASRPLVAESETRPEKGPDSFSALLAEAGQHAEALEQLYGEDPLAVQSLIQALVSMPKVGSAFLGFRLLDELGRGAFGRVYLARQEELAGRLVVLKIASGFATESLTLAQMQHSHIVPIYSVHRSGVLQAVCMPYLGATTLADVLKQVRACPTMPTSGKSIVQTLEARSQKRSQDPFPASRPLVAESETRPEKGPNVFSARKALAEQTYVEAVLWLAVQLADGLAHAHERGILHRDLKPANILLADDARPMLVDFNLSADTKLPARASAARIGGTLAYMGPEHLDAFQDGTSPVDARSDLYSFGVILYELLSGRHPFQKQSGPLKEVLPRMSADRRRVPPDVRGLNSAITPAVAAMVRHCFEPEPSRRYQSALELREDLERQLQHRPLKYAPDSSFRERAQKWRRRHPRLTSSASVGVIAILLLSAVASLLIVRDRQRTNLEAVNSLHQLEEELKSARSLLSDPDAQHQQWQEGLALGQQALERYGVLERSSWLATPPVRSLSVEDNQRLRAVMGEFLLLLARAQIRQKELPLAQRLNALAEGAYSPGDAPRVLWTQRAELAGLAGQDEEARQLQKHAESTPENTARDRYLLISDHLYKREMQHALAFLRQSSWHEYDNFNRWLMLGHCLRALGKPVDAVDSYANALTLSPEMHWGYFARGTLYLDEQDYKQACADFDEFIRLRPDVPEGYYNRALAKFHLGDLSGAQADLTQLIDGGSAPLRAYFLRADVRKRSGDHQGAGQDRQSGLTGQPRSEKDWVARGLARLPKDPRGALTDFDQALQQNPHLPEALQNKANVLAEHLGRTEEAVDLLDQLVHLSPDFVLARSGRGVLLARLGRREAAHADATEVLRRDPKPFTLYQVAGIYALTSRQHPDDRHTAFRLLSSALQRGFGFDLLDKDTDLDPIRDQPEFRRVVDAARALRETRPSKSAGQ